MLRAGMPAWLMSFLLHCTLLLVCALCFQAMPRGVREPGRGAGIVVTQAESSGEIEYFSDGGAAGNPNAGGTLLTGNASTSASLDAVDLPGADQFPQTAGPQLPSGLANLGLPGDQAGLPGAGGFTSGGSTKGGSARSSRTGIKGEATVQVFGVQGTGSRFVFVFDRSLSMSGYQGRPLAAAKRELIKSLEGLGSIHQFQIVFYNEEPKVFGGQPGQSPELRFASDENKERAESFITSITADGGTQHMDALVKALGMGPDVIFFLTDADDPKLTNDDLDRLRQRNRSGSVINCIEYGAGASQDDTNFLQRLSEQHRGQHMYVDVTKLPE